jgi:hypothetical protein
MATEPLIFANSFDATWFTQVHLEVSPQFPPRGGVSQFIRCAAPPRTGERFGGFNAFDSPTVAPRNYHHAHGDTISQRVEAPSRHRDAYRRRSPPLDAPTGRWPPVVRHFSC